MTAERTDFIGKGFTQEEFPAYCREVYSHLTPDSWRPKFAVVHHTGNPNLAQRPDGFTEAHMENLWNYYTRQQGWSGGPHLFVDDKKIWVLNPLTRRGVHAPSWNSMSFGMEMLGDYGAEPFDKGRGVFVQHNALMAMAAIHSVWKLPVEALKFHREDPRTTHRGCPGKNVSKDEFLKRLWKALSELR